MKSILSLNHNEKINQNDCSSKKLRVNELVFEIPSEVQSQMKKSRESIFNLIDNLEVFILDFDAFGKNFPKSQNVSPDAFVQLAMQLAFYRHEYAYAAILKQNLIEIIFLEPIINQETLTKVALCENII